MNLVLRRTLALLLCAPIAAFGNPDHHEFEATLHAPYQGEHGEAREFLLQLAYYGETRIPSNWRLDVTRADGAVARHREGLANAGERAAMLSILWDGLDAQGFPLTPGAYTVTLSAFPGSAAELDAALAAEQVINAPARFGDAAEVQSWPIHVGEVVPAALLPFRSMAKASRSLVAPAPLDRRHDCWIRPLFLDLRLHRHPPHSDQHLHHLDLSSAHGLELNRSRFRLRA
jgi:hypothetical protein